MVMKNTLIIGYGNSLAGDDALGFYVVKELAGTIMPEEVTVKYIHQLMPEHSQEISEYQRVIFIDAEENAEPGKLICRRVNKDDLRDTSTTAHDFTLDSILLLAEKLYGNIPEVHLITVTGNNFNVGEELSLPVKKMIPNVINMIFDTINTEKETAAYA